MRTRLISLLLALTLLFVIPAYAGTLSFSPGLDTWGTAHEQGTSMNLKAQADLYAWPDLSPETLAAIKAWLAGRQLSLSVQGKDSLAQLMAGDKALLSLMTGQEGQTAFLALDAHKGQPAARYVSGLDKPPWQALLGQDAWLPDLGAFDDAIRKLAQAALPHLAAFEKPVKTATSIKNVGSGKSQLVYTLKKEEAQAFWQAASGDLLPFMDAAIAAVSKKQARELSGSLRTMQPTGTLIIKRILDAEAQDIGLQITGTMEVDGKTRKLTLFGGVADKGLYISFKLPATRGNDTLSAQISFAWDKGNLTGDWRTALVLGKHRRNTTGSIALKSIMAEDGERVSGKLSLTDRVSGEEKRTAEYVFTPDIRFTDSSLEGSLLFQEMAGKNVRRDIKLMLTGSLGAPMTKLAPLTEMDLRTATPEQIEAAAQKVKTALMPLITDDLLQLPLEIRKLILHDLGRDARTEGESVPVVTPDNNPFTVIDESTKEETP